jgi:hypothetical protein
LASLTNWALPVLLCCGTAVAIVPGVAPARGPAGAPVAAVFPPWWSAAEAVAAAGIVGRIVRLGTVRFVVVVVPDAPTDGEDAARPARAAARLRAVGAVLVVDPLVLGGCSPAATS